METRCPYTYYPAGARKNANNPIVFRPCVSLYSFSRKNSRASGFGPDHERPGEPVDVEDSRPRATLAHHQGVCVFPDMPKRREYATYIRSEEHKAPDASIASQYLIIFIKYFYLFGIISISKIFLFILDQFQL